MRRRLSLGNARVNRVDVFFQGAEEELGMLSTTRSR